MKLILEAIKALFRNVENSCSALSGKISTLSTKLSGIQSSVAKTDRAIKDMEYNVQTLKSHVHSYFVNKLFTTSNSTVGTEFEIEIPPSNQVIIVDNVYVKTYVGKKDIHLYLNDKYVGIVSYSKLFTSSTEWAESSCRYCKITRTETGWTFVECDQGEVSGNGAKNFRDVVLTQPITKIKIEYGGAEVKVVRVGDLVAYYSPIPE